MKKSGRPIWRRYRWDWLRDKLPMPNVDQILEYNIYRLEEKDMVHSTFYYLVNNGSQFIIDRLSNGVNIYFNCSVNDLKEMGGKYFINKMEYDYVVYTGDVRRLPKIFSDQDLLCFESRLSSLLSQSISNMFCECDPNDMSWLYLPEEKTKAHRIIYTGNFSPFNNKGTNRITCSVEFSGEHNREEMIAELPHLPGNLKYLAHHYEANSYIIQTQNTDALITEVKEVLAHENLFLLDALLNGSIIIWISVLKAHSELLLK